MNNATRKFFEVVVEFYTEAGPEPITDDLIERFENKIDWVVLRNWRIYYETINDVDSLTFDSICTEDKIHYHLPEEKIVFNLNLWAEVITKLSNKVHETMNALTPLCNEYTKVNFTCSILGGGIDVTTYVYTEDIPEGQTVDNNRYYLKAKRIVLDFFQYAKSLKRNFDEYQRSVNGQTFEVRKPEQSEDNVVGTFISIDNAGIHGFGKGVDPDTTEFNKYLVKHTFIAMYDKKYNDNNLVTN